MISRTWAAITATRMKTDPHYQIHCSPLEELFRLRWYCWTIWVCSQNTVRENGDSEPIYTEISLKR